MNLRHALRGDLPVIADLWVDAFARDPFLRWIQPDDQKWPAFGGAWMTFFVELTFERGHTYLAGSPDVAVAWIPPDLSLVGPDDLARECDLEGLPCGLVSTNPRNVSFYERLGFRVDAEVATPDGAAIMRPMHRVPAGDR